MGKLKRLATWVREHPRPALALVIGALMLIAVAALWQIFGWEEMRALVIVGDILTELGIALIIYGCLALTFDGLSEHQAREAAKRTTESVLAQIDVMSVRTTATVQQQISELSRRTTETMQGQIEDVSGRTAVAIQGQIEGMNQRIYGDRVYPVFKRFRDLTFSRTALKFSMDIDDTVQNGYLALKMRFTYTVRNETGDDQPYELSIQNDELPDVAGPLISNAIFVFGDDEVPARRETSPGLVKWTATVPLRANAEVKVDTSWDYKGQVLDTYPFFMSYLSSGIEIEVTHPREYDVIASALSTTSRLKAWPQIDGRKVWTLDGDMLPGQAFVIRWKPLGQAASHFVADILGGDLSPRS